MEISYWNIWNGSGNNLELALSLPGSVLTPHAHDILSKPQKEQLVPINITIFGNPLPVNEYWLFAIKVNYFKNSYSTVFYSRVVKDGYKSF